ncbi:hypothetical protein Lalb_Chr19g0128301 [Lupinus albus]|uniref:Uncharacterized protein n=1 Tax=Lupinus albus TaxID=3870 RepID=A0A6A4NTI9_LUPAL|nr:hypothetical protein Lalb_Chr19g0128301 [Lupinus albus]
MPLPCTTVHYQVIFLLNFRFFTMDLGRVQHFLQGKNILIIGATGFLAKGN